MITKDNAPVLLGMGAIIVTLGIGTCSTNTRIDDGFTNVNLRFEEINRRMDDGFDNVHRRIDDTNQRIDDTNQRMNEGFTSINQRIDEVQSDIREIRTMLFEVLKDRTPVD
ncbi:MAG: hypothetical protein OXQ28_01860 [Acidobacteriota bacterium]|nr:hypothetical protein [Acidobacteriota bacterium]